MKDVKIQNNRGKQMEEIKGILGNVMADVDPAKYKEGQILQSCEKCGDPTIKVRLIVGTLRACKQICSCRSKQLEEQKRRDQQKEKELTLNKYFSSGWANEQMKNCTFEKWDNEKCPTEYRDRAEAYVSNFKNMLDHNVGMMILGHSGNGKTYTSAAILNAVKAQGYTGMIIQMAQLIELADSWSKNFEQRMTETAFYKKLRHADLLVIDDFGVEHKFVREKVYAIIDERLKQKLPLIVTSNLIQEELFEYHPRIISRLTECCSILSVYENKDNRKEMKERKTNYFVSIYDRWFGKKKGL